MLRKIIFIFCGFSCIFSTINCKDKDTATVSTPIAESKLVVILADVHKAESIINACVSIEKRDSTAQALYSNLYAIHQITSAELDSSVNIYLHAPLAARGLYEKVADLLSREQSEFQGQATIPQAPAQNPITTQNSPLLPSAK